MHQRPNMSLMWRRSTAPNPAKAARPPHVGNGPRAERVMRLRLGRGHDGSTKGAISASSSICSTSKIGSQQIIYCGGLI